MTKNKKASISSGLTWFVAFIIIFFIMLVYIGGVAVIAGKKYVPVFGWGENEIIIENIENNVLNENILYAFLEKKVDYGNEDLKIRGLIDKWVLAEKNIKEREKIENAIEENLNKISGIYPGKCKIFYLSYNSGNILQQLLAGSFDDEVFNDFDEDYEELVRKSTDFVLLSGNKKINGRFYIGECY